MTETIQLPTQAHPSASIIVDAVNHRIEASIDIHASARCVFAMWADVANWRTWDPGTKWAKLDGPFVQGASGKLAPPKGMAVKLVLTSVRQPHEFTAECAVLGSLMVFPHRLVDHGRFVTVTHTVEFRGWLKGMLMRSVGKNVIAGLPLTLTRLKALAEST
jgi:hypothetical protein